MADFYFFTDHGSLQNQVEADAYGSVPNERETKFNVVSNHKATGSPNAYAICSGFVFIQPDKNATDVVNLILQPLQQPSFPFVHIKYFIYRGILKNSLIAGTDVAAINTNDLTNVFWMEYKDNRQRKKKNQALLTPPSSVTGILLGNADTDLIGNAFFDATGTGQFPKIEGGNNLGKFKASAFSLEVVVDHLAFDPTFGSVRESSNTISVSALPAGATKKQVFDHYQAKEAILNYMDPCAFYGSFVEQKDLKQRSNDKKKKSITKKDIYDNLLKTFYNKNTIYIDVRNEHGRSLDYYKNYGDFHTNATPANYSTTVKIALADNTALIEDKSYYGDATIGHWPLLRIKFPAGTNNAAKNVILLRFPKGDNTLPLSFLAQGYFNTSYPKSANSKQSFKIHTISADNFTDTLKLAVANYEGANQTTAISCYTMINYYKRLTGSQSTVPTVLDRENYLDNLFPLFDLKIPYTGNYKVKSTVVEYGAYVEGMAKIKKDFIVSIGKAEDLTNITFFAFATDLREGPDEYNARFTLTGQVTNVTDVFLKSVTSVNSGTRDYTNRRVRRSTFLISGATRQYLEFYKNQDRLPYPDYNEFIAFVLTKQEFNTITSSSFLTTAGLLNQYPIYLGVKNRMQANDDLNHSYTRYDLVLRGFKNGAGNSIEKAEVATNLTVYAYGDF